MSGAEPPEVRDIEFTSEVPFVETTTRPEQRREHAVVAAVSILAGVLSVLLPVLPAAVGVAAGVIGGYSFHNWLVFDDLYGGSE